MRVLARLAGAGATCILAVVPCLARDLSLRERIEAQRAIERVSYSHQIGAVRPFEEAVSDRVLLDKVRDALRQSTALEKFWGTAITSESLERELERMRVQSRLPDRLREILHALGDDPLLAEECLARPVLAERLARHFFTRDERIHGESHEKAEEVRSRLLRGEIDVHFEHPLRVVTTFVRQEDKREDLAPSLQNGLRLDVSPEEFLQARAAAPHQVGAVGMVADNDGAFEIQAVLEDRAESFTVATYRIPKLAWDDWWRSVGPGLDDDRDSELDDCREPRNLHASADRDSDELLVSKAVPRRLLDEGTAFSSHAALTECMPLPTARTKMDSHSVGAWSAAGDASAAATAPPCSTEGVWVPFAPPGAPSERTSSTAVWTGSDMIIWGGGYGGDYLDTGSRYDPALDTWRPTSAAGAPSPRAYHTAIWSGSEMVVWGGRDQAGPLGDGARYDPSTDTWSPVAMANAPSPRHLHTAVLAGASMVVWGGVGPISHQDTLKTGGRYDLNTDTWQPTSITNAPPPRSEHTAVWTGSRMLIWGGRSYTTTSTAAGGSYDPALDLWTPISTSGQPATPYSHTAVWTGDRMIVWGGRVTGPVNRGGRYDPVADTWVSTSLTGAPATSGAPIAVWTGQEMFVWGGSSGVGTVGLYNPTTDSWRATSPVDAPEHRESPTAVWTGGLAIVWGGGFNTGGRYDPTQDKWTPTHATVSPARYAQSMVWTGSIMIAWGGIGSSFVGDGVRYDPSTDQWVPTSLTGAPAARSNHTAVWTGDRMIVWGGYGASGPVNSGGRYDPTSNTWSGVTTVNAPSPRRFHSCVWTGTRMIVWGGGELEQELSSGGRYDPIGDSWLATGSIGLWGRRDHSAVWTGSRMIVWGGRAGEKGGDLLNDGTIYDPATGMWSHTTLEGAPSVRVENSAVWSGSEMIIWGGGDGSIWSYDSGGRYKPQTDTWTPFTATGVNQGRTRHSAVWTGSSMLVWGGLRCCDGPVNTGARYDPATNAWTEISSENAPTIRFGHRATWTGSSMLVWGGGRSDGGFYFPDTTLDCDADGWSPCQGDCNDASPFIHPGAPEVCNGLDDDCDGVADEGSDLCSDMNPCTSDSCSWPSGCQHAVAPNGTACSNGNDCVVGGACTDGQCAGGVTTDEDVDSHPVGPCEESDCDDHDASVWLSPVEVRNLLLGGAATVSLSWDSQAARSGPGTVYDLVSGSLPHIAPLALSSASCLGTRASAPYIDNRVPAPGSAGFWYMVRARNLCGAGTWGTPLRDALLPPCP